MRGVRLDSLAELASFSQRGVCARAPSLVIYVTLLPCEALQGTGAMHARGPLSAWFYSC